MLCNKAKKASKTTSRHRNAVEYTAGKSFLLISLKEKLDLTVFSVRRSQYFISHTKSHIFNPGFSTVACNATPTRLAERSARHLW